MKTTMRSAKTHDVVTSMLTLQSTVPHKTLIKIMQSLLPCSF